MSDESALRIGLDAVGERADYALKIHGVWRDCIALCRRGKENYRVPDDLGDLPFTRERDVSSCGCERLAREVLTYAVNASYRLTVSSCRGPQPPRVFPLCVRVE